MNQDFDGLWAFHPCKSVSRQHCDLSVDDWQSESAQSLVMICHSRISHITCAGKHFHQWKVHKLRFHIHVTPLPLNMEFHHQNISKHVPNTRAVQSARLKGEIHTVRTMRSSLRAFGSPTAQHITTMPKALRHCMCLKLDGLWEPMGLCLHTNMSTSSYMPDQYWLIIWSVTDFWAPKPEELGNPELPPTWKKWAVKPAPEGIGDCCMICGWSITVRFMSPNPATEAAMPVPFRHPCVSQN